jgi:hypothetical protein
VQATVVVIVVVVVVVAAPKQGLHRVLFGRRGLGFGRGRWGFCRRRCGNGGLRLGRGLCFRRGRGVNSGAHGSGRRG